MLRFKSLLITALSLLCVACHTGQATGRLQQSGETPDQSQATSPGRVANYTYEIIRTYPHDSNAFTQGLVYLNGALYESTGLNGQSSLRKVDLQTGQVLKKVDLPAQFFAEGLALLNGRLFQLTWQSQRAFVYDLDSFQMLNSFNYTGEGWGLTRDAHSLIMSDGTNQIRFLNPDNFEVQRVISVYDDSRSIDNLNELEYIKGEIFANIWQMDRIVKVDPQSGRVTGRVNLSGLLSAEDRARPVDVLNGIAYDEANDRLFVTGKLWPKLFEIKLKLRRNEISR